MSTLVAQSQGILFSIFSGLMLMAAFGVIGTKNPVTSVLYLVLVFCNATGLLLILEVEFMGMIFMVVYVGAIAVLFLFVIMLLSPKIDTSGKAAGFWKWGMMLIVVCWLYNLFAKVFMARTEASFYGWVTLLDRGNVSNIESIGQVLYTYYVYYFIMAGLVLLIAMIGAIGLTLPQRATRPLMATKAAHEGKRQQVFAQIARTPEKAVFMVQRG